MLLYGVCSQRECGPSRHVEALRFFSFVHFHRRQKQVEEEQEGRHRLDEEVVDCATSRGTTQRSHCRWTERLIRCEVAQHFASFFWEAESIFQWASLDSSTSALRQLLLSLVHAAAQNADSPQHRVAGWRFIEWNEVEQRELLAEAKCFLETGEL